MTKAKLNRLLEKYNKLVKMGIMTYSPKYGYRGRFFDHNTGKSWRK